MDSGSEWDVHSLPSDFSISLPSSPGHGPSGSPREPGTPLSLHSVPDSAFSLSPNSASHVFLPYPHDDRSLDTSRTLVLPSLPWPQIPSLYGETLGEMKLLLVSRASVPQERQRVRRAMLDQNSDVLRVYETEIAGDGKRTTWADTVMKFGDGEEGSRNVCLTELAGYDEHGALDEVIRSILCTAYEPFRAVETLLNPASRSSTQLLDLLASSGSHLYIACIFLLPPEPTPLEHTLYRVLEATMPVLTLDFGSTSYRAQSSSSSSSSASRWPLHSTHTLPELVYTLFRSPQRRDQLRRDAAAGFLSWWCAERESRTSVGSEAVAADKGPEPDNDVAFPTTVLPFRSLPMPVLDPLHHSLLLLPVTLIPPILQRMTRFDWGCAARDRSPSPSCAKVPRSKDESWTKDEPPALSPPDRTGPFWTWRNVVGGIAGFAAMTALWAGLVWATSVSG